MTSEEDSDVVREREAEERWNRDEDVLSAGCEKVLVFSRAS